MNAEDIIKQLDLKPHPEGGHYKETYRSEEQIITKNGLKRAVCTGIYFLLQDTDKSHLHRIKSDETWLFHQGQILELFYIQDEKRHVVYLGNELNKGEVPKFVIPAGVWFGAKLKDSKGYALVSCMVAPGFDFSDFELGQAEKHPELADYKEFLL